MFDSEGFHALSIDVDLWEYKELDTIYLTFPVYFG